MENCIFCKIIQNEPTHVVYEDENFVAFLDIHPKSPGHCQVVPKKHYRWVWDVPNAGEYFEVARKIALAQKKAFNTDIVLSKVEGMDVPHAHIWVYPNLDTGGDLNDFAANAERIRKELA